MMHKEKENHAIAGSGSPQNQNSHAIAGSLKNISENYSSETINILIKRKIKIRTKSRGDLIGNPIKIKEDLNMNLPEFLDALEKFIKYKRIEIIE